MNKLITPVSISVLDLYMYLTRKFALIVIRLDNSLFNSSKYHIIRLQTQESLFLLISPTTLIGMSSVIIQ